MSVLANQLIQQGYLKTDVIIDAFAEVGRVEFLPERFVSAADHNVALPIGHGQIVPTPAVVALMLELLHPARGHNILILGSGSGWVTVLLSFIVGAQGHVSAVEEFADLLSAAQKNVAKYNFVSRDAIATLQRGPLEYGDAAYAPFDRVLVMRSLADIPAAVVEQTAVGGKIVVPLDDIVTYCEKTDDGLTREPFSGIVFSQS